MLVFSYQTKYRKHLNEIGVNVRAFKNILPIMLCLSINSGALANEMKNCEERTNKQQIAKVFKNYMIKYNHFITKQELKLTPELYAQQVMLMTGNGKSTTLTPEKMNQGVTGFLTQLKSKGVNKIAWEAVEIKLLTDNIALASNIAVRYLANGEVYDRAGATYFLNKAETGWEISAFALHAPDKTINFSSES